MSNLSMLREPLRPNQVCWTSNDFPFIHCDFSMYEFDGNHMKKISLLQLILLQQHIMLHQRIMLHRCSNGDKCRGPPNFRVYYVALATPGFFRRIQRCLKFDKGKSPPTPGPHYRMCRILEDR